VWSRIIIGLVTVIGANTAACFVFAGAAKRVDQPDFGVRKDL
jgi:hypothetical protein